MSLQVEALEHNMVKLVITVPAAEFDAALVKAYNKQKGSIAIPGFRKGKVPFAMIEKMYGPEVFYEEAANIVIPDSYEVAVEEFDKEIVSRPEIDITQIKKGEDFIYTATVAVKPEVKLGQYKGIEVEKATIRVTEKEINEEVDKAREKNAREVEVDRASENGDVLVLDYAGSVDGVAFDGGTAQNQTLVLGSNTFIPGFEDQLIGVKAGESKDVVVTFPEVYHSSELAGKEAVFACTVKEVKVKELPEADDDFAQDVSEFDTLKDYKADIKKQIKERKEEEAKAKKQTEIIEAIIDNSEMDIPEAMIQARVDLKVDEYSQQLAYSGITIDQFLQMTGSSIEQLREQFKPVATKEVQNQLVLEAIVEAEQFEITDEDIDNEMNLVAANYGMPVEDFKKYVGDEQKSLLMDQAKNRKALDLVCNEAVEITKAQAAAKAKEDK